MHPLWIVYIVFMAIAVPFAVVELWRVTRPGYKHWSEELADMRPRKKER